MLKRTLISFALPVVLLLGNESGNPAAQSAAAQTRGAESKQNNSQGQTGTLEKMIVASGSVDMDLDLNRLNSVAAGVSPAESLRFAVTPNSFFPILVFNDLLRAAETGSMTLIPQNTAGAVVNDPGYGILPAALHASLGQLAIQKMDWDA